jgi:hypothetical protein
MQSLDVSEEYLNEFKDDLNLPQYLYSPIFVQDIKQIKKSGLSPNISNKSWNDNLENFIFLTINSDFAGEIAKESNKVNPSVKESIFILQFDTEKLNKNNIFIYNFPENKRERLYVYHGELSYQLVNIAFSYE